MNQLNLFQQSPSGATFSECGKYRYKLWRIWNDLYPKAMCIGLNPSTANADKNDPTITNLRSILSKLGFGGFYMVNLFGYISSHPEDLLKVDDPVGYHDQYLKAIQTQCAVTIFCWGNFKQAEDRVREIVKLFPNAKCFGYNTNGTPYHPLALMYKGLVKSPELIKYETR